MTKKQKIWLGVFLAMFIIPEVLWSPVLGIFKFGKSFLESSDNHTWITIIILIEIIGSIGFIIQAKDLASKIIKFLLFIFFIFFIVKALYIFYLLVATFNF